MKKLVTISLFIFWAVVVAILVASLVYYQGNKKTNSYISSVKSPVPTSTGTVNGNPAASSTLILNMVEISKHNSINDCWLLINNKVYDVTSFVSSHPGGPDTIALHCGQEATQAYNTKDIGRPHSNQATNMLQNYYVGDLVK
jgi:cytochrome b involved in lipid metabolism